MSEKDTAVADSAAPQTATKRSFFASPAGISSIVGGVFALIALVGVAGFLVTSGGGAGPGPRAGGASTIEAEVTRYLRRNDLDAIVRFDRITTGLFGGGLTLHGVRIMADADTLAAFDRIQVPHWRIKDGVLERVRIEIDGYVGDLGPFGGDTPGAGHPLNLYGVPADAFNALAADTSTSKIHLEWRFNPRDQSAALEYFNHQSGLSETRINVNFGNVEPAALRDLGRVIDDTFARLRRLRQQDLSSADAEQLLGEFLFVTSARQWLERNGRRIEVTGWRTESRDLGAIAAVQEALAYIRMEPRSQVSLAQMVMEARRSENPRIREYFERQERTLGSEYLQALEVSLAPRGRLIVETDFRRGGYPLFEPGQLRYLNEEHLVRDRELIFSNR